MKILFRVDATSAIGTGHLMRCLTLATELKFQACSIYFASRHLPKPMMVLIDNCGFELLNLNYLPDRTVPNVLAHSRWLDASQKTDAECVAKLVFDLGVELVVVDHYSLGSVWEELVAKKCRLVAAIDDLFDRSHNVNLLLNQNLVSDPESAYDNLLLAPKTQLLIGPKYSLLRREFGRAKKNYMPRTGKVKNILVFFGGVDKPDMTARTVEVLSSILDDDVLVRVVVGNQYPYITNLQNQCAIVGYECHVQTNKMARFMGEADMAIGASGAATWERACLGLPSIVITIADNQLGIARQCDGQRVALSLGAAEDIGLLQMKTAIEMFINDTQKRESMSLKCFELVNGQGAELVARELMAL